MRTCQPIRRLDSPKIPSIFDPRARNRDLIFAQPITNLPNFPKNRRRRNERGTTSFSRYFFFFLNRNGKICSVCGEKRARITGKRDSCTIIAGKSQRYTFRPFPFQSSSNFNLLLAVFTLFCSVYCLLAARLRPLESLWDNCWFCRIWAYYF